MLTTLQYHRNTGLRLLWTRRLLPSLLLPLVAGHVFGAGAHEEKPGRVSGLVRHLHARASLAPVAAGNAGEYEVKAAHLPKFASYIQWPAGTLTPGNLVIGLVGRDPSGGTIEAALNGAVFGGRRVEVRRVQATDTTALRECAVLFIGASEEGRAADILRQVQGRPVLTVGETEDFAAGGGMLQFIIADGQVRFIANPGAAERSGVKMDSNLLRLARRRIGG